MEKNHPQVFSDISLIAYLCLATEEEPEPVICEGGRISFRFHSDVTKAIAQFHADAKIPVSSYVSKVKAIHSRIFALRGGIKKPDD